MKNLFSIGQLSKLYDIPVKTLRYYDDIDLFKPIEVKQNGYRYYSIEQFKLLDTINFLKALGVPLKEIKNHISNRDIDVFIQTLKRHIEQTEQKIESLKMIKKGFETRLSEIEKFKDLEEVGVPFIQFLSIRKVFELKEKIYSLHDLELAVRKLKQKIPLISPLTIGKIGLTLSSSKIEEMNNYEYHSIFFLLDDMEEKAVSEANMTIIPEGKYVCIYYRGGHLQTPYYYKTLLHYIKGNNYQIDGEIIIRTVIDQFISNDENKFVTEIQIPIC